MSTRLAENSGGICYVQQIPGVCAGAEGSQLVTSTAYLNESGTVAYVHSAAIYAIGKLATQLPSYNPTASTLELYNFTPADLANGVLTSGAVEYTLNYSGAIVLGSTTSISGGACVQNYAPSSSGGTYNLIVWEPGYITSGGGWLGAGGFCSCTQVICASGYVKPGPGITSPPGIVNTLIALTVAPTVAAAAKAGKGGGGDSSGSIISGGCDVFIGAVTDPPAGGFGLGAVKRITFNTDGSYNASGATVAVVFPYIG